MRTWSKEKYFHNFFSSNLSDVRFCFKFQVVEEIARLDLDGDDLDDLDKKFLQWRDGLHNRDSMDYFRIL